MAGPRTFRATNGDLIWFPRSGNRSQYYSTDGGSTWTQGTLSLTLEQVSPSKTTAHTFYGVTSTQAFTMSYDTSTKAFTNNYGSSLASGTPRAMTVSSANNIYMYATSGAYGYLYVWPTSQFVGYTPAQTYTVYSDSSGQPEAPTAYLEMTSNGRLFLAYTKGVSGSYPVTYNEYTISGTTLTLESSTDQTLTKQHRFVRDIETGEIIAYSGANRRTRGSTSWSSWTATSGPTEFVAVTIVRGPTNAPKRIIGVTATQYSNSVGVYWSVDGLTFKNTNVTMQYPSNGIYWEPAPSAYCDLSTYPETIPPYVWLSRYSAAGLDATAKVNPNTVPSAIPSSPVSGTESYDQTVDIIPLVWEYSDFEGTSQTAYKALIAENTAGATSYYITSGGTLTTTDTTVASSEVTASINPGVLAASAYGYAWSVLVRDSDQTWSAQTAWNTFRVSGRPVVYLTTPRTSVTAPGWTVFTTNTPTFTFKYTDPEANVIHSHRVKVYPYGSSTALWDSGPVFRGDYLASGSSVDVLTTYELPDGTYTVGIQAQDSTGRWSSESQATFIVAQASATAPTITTSVGTDAVVTVSVSSSETAFSYGKLYRWSNRLSKYVLVTTSNSRTFTYEDRCAPTGGSFTYQVAMFGTPGVKRYTSSTVTTTLKEWRIAEPPRTSGYNFQIPFTPDRFSPTDAVAQESLEPLGRSRQVVVREGRYGFEGSLTARFLPSERSIVSDLELAASVYATGTNSLSSFDPIYIRTPLNATYAVSLGPPQVNVTPSGITEVTVPFTEIGDA